MTFHEFPWPRVPGKVPAPIWAGDGFLLGSEQLEILSYGESQSAWSDELTLMHETEASSTHPIDVASRALAIESIRELADRPDQIVLDVGCSTGFFVQDIKRHFTNVSVFGADYLTGVVLKAARRNPNIPFVQFDLRKCPLPDRCLHGITALNVLEHIDDDFTALSEIYRILIAGGVAHVEVPAGPSCFDLYDEVLMHFRRYRLKDLARMARKIGFEVRAASHLGFLIYPAFRLVKLRNRARFAALPLPEKQSIVKQHISATGSSLAMQFALDAELSLGRFFRFPFGIRAVAKLRKP